MDLHTRVGKWDVEGVIGNSPGPKKSIEECHEVGKSAAGMITLGSLTAQARAGNQGDVYWAEGAPEVVLNSLGLPTQPPESYLDRIGELEVYGKPIVTSLAGFSTAEFVSLAEMFGGRGYSIELNMTCPNNVEGKGIFAFDLSAVRQTIKEVRRVIGTDNPIVKLNYHPDSSYVQAMCELLNEEEVGAVALCNTLPNAMVISPQTLRPVITPNNGLAGQSGTSIRPVVTGQVYQYRRLLRPEISIICEGGVWTGWDILSYFIAGGDFCRSAAKYGEMGAKIFTQLTTEFIEEMEQRGFESLADIPRLEGLPSLQPA